MQSQQLPLRSALSLRLKEQLDTRPRLPILRHWSVSLALGILR